MKSSEEKCSLCSFTKNWPFDPAGPHTRKGERQTDPEDHQHLSQLCLMEVSGNPPKTAWYNTVIEDLSLSLPQRQAVEAGVQCDLPSTRHGWSEQRWILTQTGPEPFSSFRQGLEGDQDISVATWMCTLQGYEAAMLSLVHIENWRKLASTKMLQTMGPRERRASRSSWGWREVPPVPRFQETSIL